MKTKTYGAIALLAAILALVLFVRDSHRLQAARAELVSRTAKQVQLRREADQFKAALATLKGQEEVLLDRLHPTKAAEVAEVVADPVQRRTKVLRAWFALSNARLNQRLNLSADMARQFEDLEVTHELRLEDIAAEERTQGLAADDPAIQALRSQENFQFAQAEADLLSPEELQTAQNYDRLAAGYMWADAVAGNVFDSGAPLSGKQADALAQIVANNSPSYQNGGPALSRDANFQGVLQQAQNILSPDQLAGLQTYLTAISAARSLAQLGNPAFQMPPP